MGDGLVQVAIGLLFLGAGLGGVVWTWYQGRKVMRSHSWPSVTGVIGWSEVVTSRTGKSRVYGARIQYDYEVNGRHYEGRTICVGGKMNTANRTRAQERCALYPVGARVQVYFDPADPRRCCLERTCEDAWLGYLAGNAVAVAGLAVMAGFMPFH